MKKLMGVNCNNLGHGVSQSKLRDPKRQEVQEFIRTALCELLGIEHPIIQAGMGPFAPASLAAAVSNAGGLGSLGTFGLDPIKLVRPGDDLDRQFASIRELTDRPFAINFVVPHFEEHVDERAALFDRGLSIQPKLVSFALGDPGDLVKRAHDAGALVMHQVTTVGQAEQAAARGVDVIVAQGDESGGYGGSVATMVLVPQVVDAVRPIRWLRQEVFSTAVAWPRLWCWVQSASTSEPGSLLLAKRRLRIATNRRSSRRHRRTRSSSIR
jgi:hypothetical protein